MLTALLCITGKCAAYRVENYTTDVPALDIKSVSYFFLQCNVKLGPESVGYRITEEAICFGGDICTATDVAIAAGVAPGSFCSNEERLVSLSPAKVYAVMREIKRQLEATIDSMKVEREDVTVVLVGGGCILVDPRAMLRGVANVVTPPQHWVSCLALCIVHVVVVCVSNYYLAWA